MMIEMMDSEEVQKVVAQKKETYGNQFEGLAKECLDLPASKAYEKYMNAMPGNEDEHEWAVFIMALMDEIIARK